MIFNVCKNDIWHRITQNTAVAIIQGDHSPDNVKFPDNSLTFPRQFTTLRSTRHVKCYSYHALNACKDAKMQLTINIFRPLFPDKIFSLTIP